MSYFIFVKYGRIENGARVGNDYTLAHELGHTMYFTNYYGDIKDPKPNVGKILPNGEIPIISEEQIKKALQSIFFKNNVKITVNVYIGWEC